MNTLTLRLLCYLFFCFLLSIAAKAQSSVPDTSTSAQFILSQSRVSFFSLKDFSTDFVYSLYTHPNQHPPVSGKIWYKDAHFYLELKEQQIYCDGNTQWEYNKKEQEVRIFDHDPNQGIGLIFNIYLKSAEAVYIGKEKLGETECYIIGLSKLPTSKYSVGKLWINTKTMLPIKIFAADSRRTEVSFLFSRVKLNQNLTNQFFHFDVKDYPNVSIIDERTRKINEN